MKKYKINGLATFHFEVEIEARDRKEAENKVCGLDSNDVDFSEMFIEGHNLDIVEEVE